MHVDCAFDGLSVLEQVASHQPEVVLLDIGLPGMDGYQVAEQLRERYPKEELTLIAVTGYGGELNQCARRARGIRPFPRQAGKPLGAQRIACRSTDEVVATMQRTTR